MNATCLAWLFTLDLQIAPIWIPQGYEAASMVVEGVGELCAASSFPPVKSEAKMSETHQGISSCTPAMISASGRAQVAHVSPFYSSTGPSRASYTSKLLLCFRYRINCVYGKWARDSVCVYLSSSVQRCAWCFVHVVVALLQNQGVLGGVHPLYVFNYRFAWSWFRVVRLYRCLLPLRFAFAPHSVSPQHLRRFHCWCCCLCFHLMSRGYVEVMGGRR